MIGVLGAYGVTGAEVARALCADGEVVALAGRNRGRLEALARSLPRTVETRVVDAVDDDALTRLGSDCTVVVQCVGPYATRGAPIATALARGGAHVVDLTGEQPYIQQCRAEVDRVAREAGVALVHSCGVEGALADCAAAVAARGLVRVDEVQIAGAVRRASLSRGSRRSLMAILAGPSWAWSGGRSVLRDPASRGRRLELGEGWGARPGVWIPAPEILLIPRHLDVAEVSCWLAVPRGFGRAVRGAARVIGPLVRGPVGPWLTRGLAAPAGAPAAARDRFRIVVDVAGEAPQGRRVMRTVLEGSGVYALSARLAAWVAAALHRRADGPTGSLAPAEAVDPPALLAHASSCGLDVRHAEGSPAWSRLRWA